MKISSDHNVNWNNDAIQFPRLIAELEIVGVFTQEIMEKLSQEMDLLPADIVALIERAQLQWDDIKSKPETLMPVITRKLLKTLLKPAQVISVNGVYCWVAHKTCKSDAKLNEVILSCVRAFDGREINFKLGDLLGRPVSEQGIHTSLGEMRFFQLTDILP